MNQVCTRRRSTAGSSFQSVCMCLFLCVPACAQAAALVHIYKDGSVLVTHGGTEMGQGIHTKVQQVGLRPPAC